LERSRENESFDPNPPLCLIVSAQKKITEYFFSKSFVSSKSLYMFGNIISQSRKRHLRMLVKEEEKVKDKIHCKWK